MRKKSIIFAAIALACMGTVTLAVADWFIGDDHKMHYPQLPIDLVDPSMNGIDVAFMHNRLADDWRCTGSGPVSEIHFWVSWRQNEVFPIGPFMVRIWSDNPMGPGGYSIPDMLLWERMMFPPDYMVREIEDHIQDWFNPWTGEYYDSDHYRWQQINIVGIQEPFIQDEGLIYWLEIEMMETPNIGWKVSGREQYRDTAVFWAGNIWRELVHPHTNEPLDLAFVISGDETAGCWLCCPFGDGGMVDPLGSGNVTPDMNGDGIVDLSDFARFAACYVGLYDYCCDFNCDGVVNLVDFAMFAAHYGHSGPVQCHCP